MAFSQMTGSFGLWTSTRWTTGSVSVLIRNPKLAASGDAPSRIRAAPDFTFACQSADAAVVGVATKISAVAAGPGMWPTAESTAGHEPVSGPSVLNVPPKHAGASSAANRLLSKRIPDPCAEIVEIGTSRIAFVTCVD